MKTALSVSIGVAMTLSAVPFVALGHETGVLHEHSTETEQRRLVASTTDARPIRIEPKHLFGEASSTRPAFREEVGDRREQMRADLEAKREQMKGSLQAKREKFEEEGKKRMGALKKKFGEERGARIEEYFKKMIEKFEAAIERQKKFADKITEFVDKAEANGKDVSLLRTKLTTADDALLEAESVLEEAKAKYAEAATATDFTARFAVVRAIVEGVAEKVKASHRALVDVLNSIKGLGASRHDDSAATTTTP